MNLLLVVATGLALAISVSDPVQSQEVTSVCPDGWTPWQSYCYLFVNSTRTTWSQAKNECADRQGHLLRVETLDEYDFIRKALLQFPSDTYWTALNDLALNEPQSQKGTGTFMWGSDEFPLDDIVKNHWDQEPDNTDFDDCVAVDIQSACSVSNCNRRHGYICEITKEAEEFCPNTWVPSYAESSLCYYVSNATAWSQTVTWDQARKTCETLAPFQDSRKARMLTITSQNVQTFLASQLSLLYYGRQLFWTGLNDKDHEGTFVWAGNEGTPYQDQYMKWRKEPNNLAGKEHCGVLQPGARWGDRNCDDMNNYACRLALPDSPALFNSGCGSWTRAGRKCVFVYNSPLKNWKDARSFCQGMRGDLYKFDNQDDSLWLMTQSGSRLSMSGYWIGLNDQQTENTFVWADGSSSDPEMLTWDREPRGYEGRSGIQLGCAVMGYDGFFLDMSCWRQKAGSVCEEATGVCGTGWVSHNGHCYLIDTKYRTHGEAKDNCKTSSVSGAGHLFALNTKDEKDWLTTQLSQTKNGTYFYWSDLIDQGVGDWRWSNFVDDDPVATQSLVTWNHEPNNWKNNEDCVQVNVNGLLNDANCQHAMGFICQKTVPGLPALNSGALGTTGTAPTFPVLTLVLALVISLASRCLLRRLDDRTVRF